MVVFSLLLSIIELLFWHKKKLQGNISFEMLILCWQQIYKPLQTWRCLVHVAFSNARYKQCVCGYLFVYLNKSLNWMPKTGISWNQSVEIQGMWRMRRPLPVTKQPDCPWPNTESTVGGITPSHKTSSEVWGSKNWQRSVGRWFSHLSEDRLNVFIAEI